jgi:hypothetical protein
MLVRAVADRESSRQELGRRVFYRYCRNQGSAGPLPIEIGSAEAWSSRPTRLLPKIYAGPARFLYELRWQGLGHAVARSRCPKSTVVRAATYRFFENRRLVTPALLASAVGPGFPNAVRIDFAPAERLQAAADSARAVGSARNGFHLNAGMTRCEVHGLAKLTRGRATSNRRALDGSRRVRS